MAHIFATRQLPGKALGRLAVKHDVDLWTSEQPPTREQLLAHTHNAEGLLCTLSDSIDADLIDACPRLRVISNYGVGIDNIDIAAAQRRGIAVGNTPDVLTAPTADLAFALILACARRVPELDKLVRDGGWKDWGPTSWLGNDVTGTTLGIVGYGRIGRAVAQRARGFEMQVIHSSRSGGVPLTELLATADYVSLHCPLTPDTYHLIGEHELALMKNSAILINTARGKIVDQNALTQALISGTIAGAGVDVTDPEPIPVDDPLLSAPNLMVLPHVGSATYSTRAQMAEMAVDNLLAGLESRPLPYSAIPAQ
jgi:glyoxylate reductase